MKRLFIIFLAVFTFGMLQSCNKNDSGLTSKSVNGELSQYCSDIDDYVADNGLGSIASVTVKEILIGDISKEVHVVELNEGPCLIFDVDCVFLFNTADCPE